MLNAIPGQQTGPVDTLTEFDGNRPYSCHNATYKKATSYVTYVADLKSNSEKDVGY